LAGKVKKVDIFQARVDRDKAFAGTCIGVDTNFMLTTDEMCRDNAQA
jgi:hypothetical protein